MTTTKLGSYVSQGAWWAASVALFIGIWELTFALGWYDETILPPPHVFVPDFPNQAMHFDFGHQIAGEELAGGPLEAVITTTVATILRVLAGLTLGFSLGVVTGAAARYFGWFGRLTLPTITLLAPISPFAWLPIAVFMFGIGNMPAIFLVFLAVYFIITLATIAEVDAVNLTYLNVARIMGATRWQMYFQVILPAVLPGLFVILRLNMFAAWVIVLIAESAGVGSGLGAVIMLARNTANNNLVFLGIVVIGVVGFVFDVGLRQVQRRMLYWVVADQAWLQK